jgi:hypothetical protein
MANVENPEIQQAYEDVRTDSTGYNWYAHSLSFPHHYYPFIGSVSCQSSDSVIILSFAASTVTTLYIRAWLHSVN